MTTINDELGVWNQLGQVTPIVGTWSKFPVISNGANRTFRATFFCVNFAKIHSFAYIRSEFFTANTSQVVPAIRLYPKQETFIFELPIPKDLLDRNIYLRHIEVMKVFRRTKPIGFTSDIDWTIKLEEIW